MRVISRASLIAAAMLLVAVAGHAVLRADVARAAGAVTAAQELPDGPGKAEVSKICAGCHDLMFTVSTRDTEEGWTRIVNDMRSKGADGQEEEFEKIIAYLTKYMGKP